MKRIIFLLFLAFIFIIPANCLARENVDYWYIKDYESQITLGKDSSLDIVENITADCGSAQKHGIFRVLPTVQYLDNRTIESPITLKSITDFNGKPYKYSTSKNLFDHTITWKIGEQDTLVTGVNNYRITYSVKNAIRPSSNPNEFYWNLNGNFWDIPIDSYKAKIIFPSGITQDNTNINLYSGTFADENSLNPQHGFTSPDTLEVSLDKTMESGSGITVSAVFPSGIINPYKPTFLEKYGALFSYLIPILIFLLCIKLWQKFGRDPKINPTVAPEFEIPENLSPIEMGLIYTDGTLKNSFISASIINLAVNGFIKIKQIKEKSLLQGADFELERIKDTEPKSLAEKILFSKLFDGKKKIVLSSLKNNFYTNLDNITQAGRGFLIGKKYLVSYSKTLFYAYLVFGLILLFSSTVLIAISTHLGVAILLTSLIILAFSPLMRKRTEEGHKIFRRILGFKLYMDKAEKFRQQYLEKENVFEKVLPYAIMFGITSGWIKKMKNIYGEKYFAGYHPIWFYGAGLSSFDADSFSSNISQISSNMASTMSSTPSSSGSGGGGFSGGGGGGGGGGGW